VIGVLEVAGYAVVAGAAAQAAAGVSGAVQRQVLARRRAAAEARLFEERAQIILREAELERDRHEMSWDGYRKFYIDRKVTEAKDVCSFYLKPHDRKPLPPFLPGQYLTFQLRIPGEPKPVVRCYSLSDSPARLDAYRVTIKRLGPPPDAPDAPPGLSSSFFHSLRDGDILDVKAANGHFVLDRSSERPVVLIAGGVGLTPLVSMLNDICASSRKRETWFFYGVRNRVEHAMYDHLQEIRQHENVRLVVCYSQPTATCVAGRDYDHQGFVSVELIKTRLPSNNYDFLICGPPPMMAMITRDLAAWGVPESDVHFEAFGPATVKRATPAEEAVVDAGVGHEVVFARSGKTLTWQPTQGSLLDFARRNGVAIDSGCEAGNCGTCTVAVKSGSVRYLIEPSAPLEIGSCLTCVGVPAERVVLDA
jgi:uncharacterized protein